MPDRNEQARSYKARRALRNIADGAMHAERPVTKADVIEAGITSEPDTCAKLLEKLRGLYVKGEHGEARRLAEEWAHAAAPDFELPEVDVAEERKQIAELVANTPRP